VVFASLGLGILAIGAYAALHRRADEYAGLRPYVVSDVTTYHAPDDPIGVWPGRYTVTRTLQLKGIEKPKLVSALKRDVLAGKSWTVESDFASDGAFSISGEKDVTRTPAFACSRIVEGGIYRGDPIVDDARPLSPTEVFFIRIAHPGHDPFTHRQKLRGQR
jgi:hypothetical protein